MRRAAARAAAGIALVALAGCDGPGLGRPWDLERMLDQPYLQPYEASALAPGGMAMRAPPAGTVPRTPAADEPPPPAPDAALLALGRARFETVCGPCHGVDGRAATPVAQSMTLRPPPSLLRADLRSRDPASIARVIAFGYGLMPSYRELLDARERGAVAWYVKALQLAGETPLDALPPAVRAEASAALPEPTP